MASMAVLCLNVKQQLPAFVPFTVVRRKLSAEVEIEVLM